MGRAFWILLLHSICGVRTMFDPVSVATDSQCLPDLVWSLTSPTVRNFKAGHDSRVHHHQQKQGVSSRVLQGFFPGEDGMITETRDFDTGPFSHGGTRSSLQKKTVIVCFSPWWLGSPQFFWNLHIFATSKSGYVSRKGPSGGLQIHCTVTGLHCSSPFKPKMCFMMLYCCTYLYI